MGGFYWLTPTRAYAITRDFTLTVYLVSPEGAWWLGVRTVPPTDHDVIGRTTEGPFSSSADAIAFATQNYLDASGTSGGPTYERR